MEAETNASIEQTSSSSTDELKENVVKPKSLIDEAREAAAELRKENAARLELLKKEEELIGRREALRELGGDSTAGQRPNKADETPLEYTNRILKGG